MFIRNSDVDGSPSVYARNSDGIMWYIKPDDVAAGWRSDGLAGDGLWNALHLFPFSWDRTVVAMAGENQYTPRIFGFNESINRKGELGRTF